MNLTKHSVNKTNISLAVQLSMDWLISRGMMATSDSRTHCTDAIISGIEKFHWPGRYQLIERGEKKFYLDGAHTLESIEACLEWYEETCRADGYKCLIFYVTGTRDVESLAKPILDRDNFDLIIICPNVVSSKARIMDNVTANMSTKDVEDKCQDIGNTFQKLIEGKAKDERKKTTRIEVSSSVCDALELIDSVEGGVKRKDVLITGSLYLVGNALIALS